MNLAKDIAIYLADGQYHTLGEILSVVGPKISAEKATQILAKDSDGTTMVLDEKIRAGRRRKILNTITKATKTFERDLSPENAKAEKETVLARRFRIIPGCKSRLVQSITTPPYKTSESKLRKKKPSIVCQTELREIPPLLDQLRALYQSRLNGDDLEDALRHIRELSRIVLERPPELMPTKPEELLGLPGSEQTTNHPADVDVTNQPIGPVLSQTTGPVLESEGNDVRGQD